ncbi:hypothetical protein OnM2_086027, partial [Erysiphe neolycopersici]
MDTEDALSGVPIHLHHGSPLPSEAIYSSKEELYTSIQAWAAQHHYAFMIGRSKKTNNGPRIKIFYNCDRHVPPPSDNHPQKHLQDRR